MVNVRDAVTFQGLRRLRVIGLLATCIWFSFLSQACKIEIDTSVQIIDLNNPPTFTLSGNGYLARFAVYGPLPDFQYQENWPIVWAIVPDAEMAEKRISKLQSITFGKLPIGFKEINPIGKLEALSEGKLYSAVANTNGANTGYLHFTIRDGKIIELPKEK